MLLNRIFSSVPKKVSSGPMPSLSFLVLSIGKTKTHSLLKLLTELGFVQVIGGSPNRGFTYKLCEQDTLDKTIKEIKQSLGRRFRAVEKAD